MVTQHWAETNNLNAWLNVHVENLDDTESILDESSWKRLLYYNQSPLSGGEFAYFSGPEIIRKKQ